jgi:DNA-directed RNA polymerase subunit RPC12/RpoP
MSEKKEDTAVAICSECKTQMPDSQAFKDGFLQEGKAGVCKACGGVVVVVMRSDLKRAMEQMDRQRGI